VTREINPGPKDFQALSGHFETAEKMVEVLTNLFTSEKLQFPRGHRLDERVIDALTSTAFPWNDSYHAGTVIL
jgi:hypothetical protein